MTKPLVTIFLSSLLVAPTAAISIKNLEKEMQTSSGSDFMITYIGGVGMGFMFSNMALVAEGNAMLFCMPRDKQPNPQEFLEMIFEAEEKGLVDDSVQAEVALLARLKSKYPC